MSKTVFVKTFYNGSIPFIGFGPFESKEVDAVSAEAAIKHGYPLTIIEQKAEVVTAPVVAPKVEAKVEAKVVEETKVAETAKAAVEEVKVAETPVKKAEAVAKK